MKICIGNLSHLVNQNTLRKKVQSSCLLDKEVLGRQPEEYLPLRKQITISSLAYHHYFMLREKRSKKIAYLKKIITKNVIRLLVLMRGYVKNMCNHVICYGSKSFPVLSIVNSLSFLLTLPFLIQK